MLRSVFFLLFLASWFAPAPLSSQVPAEGRHVAPDTYADAGVERLLDRARAARLVEITGIQSYEARAWERVYVGVTGSGFRRERALYTGERVARVRWEEEQRIVRWEGAIETVPVVGMRSDEDEEMANRLVENLSSLSGSLSPALYTPGFAPGDDRIIFSDERAALHPVSDTAHLHYRYRSGDTLRVGMGAEGRTITLVEVRVEPRIAHPQFVVGSLWFDGETGQIVRAAYRPSRPYYLAAEGGDPDRIRGLQRAFHAEIRQVTVDYGFHHIQWWLPHRYALVVEVRMGGLIQIPVTFEWQMDDYRINEPPDPAFDPELAPEGWVRQEIMRPVQPGGPESEPADSLHTITLVPPADSLHVAPELGRAGPGRVAADPVGFSEQELEEFRRELDRILPPRLAYSPRLAWGLEDGLIRYNRVEGLSVGLAGETPVRRGVAGRAEIRLGTADRVPLGELRLQRGNEGSGERISAYRRTAHMSDWEDPLGLAASLASILAGLDHGEYYRATGVEFSVVRREMSGAPELRLFAEAHRSVERRTDFHITGMFSSDTLRANRLIHEGTWYGGSLTLRGDRSSADDDALRLFGTLLSEVAWSEKGGYRRIGGSVGAARTLGPVALAVEGGAGAGWGALPPQREFHLGGPATLRGIRTGSMVGESFWFARAELARGFPAWRFALFADWGWTGRREDLGSGVPARSLGAGSSFLDGLVRIDLARALSPTPGWRLHVYLDGLL